MLKNTILNDSKIVNKNEYKEELKKNLKYILIIKVK